MKYLDELRALNLPEDGFAVFGSGPLAVRGLRENDDLDVIVRKSLWDGLASRFNPRPAKFSGEIISVGAIELFYDMSAWFDDSGELIDTADVIGGIRFVKLDYILQWKKMMGREKDIRDIELIEHYLCYGGKDSSYYIG